jgi:hypothetical protein
MLQITTNTKYNEDEEEQCESNVKLWGIKTQDKNEASIVQNHNNTLSDDEPNQISSFNDSNENAAKVADDEQYKLFVQKQVKKIEDMMENALEVFV